MAKEAKPVRQGEKLGRIFEMIAQKQVGRESAVPPGVYDGKWYPHADKR